MSRPRVIICERTGIWATAIRRHLPADVAISQSCSPAECASLLAGTPTSLVALELTPRNLADVLDMVCTVSERFEGARSIVLAQNALEDCWPLLREAGAVHVFDSPRRLDGLRQTAANHFRRCHVEQTDYAEGIWNSLPWSNAVTA
jgi:hypothetical protein